MKCKWPTCVVDSGSIFARASAPLACELPGERTQVKWPTCNRHQSTASGPLVVSTSQLQVAHLRYRKCNHSGDCKWTICRHHAAPTSGPLAAQWAAHKWSTCGAQKGAFPGVQVGHSCMGTCTTSGPVTGAQRAAFPEVQVGHLCLGACPVSGPLVHGGLPCKWATCGPSGQPASGPVTGTQNGAQGTLVFPIGSPLFMTLFHFRVLPWRGRTETLRTHGCNAPRL